MDDATREAVLAFRAPVLDLLPPAPKLLLSSAGETATAAQRGSTPFITAKELLESSACFQHRRPSDLVAIRSVLAADRKLAQSIGLEMPPRKQAITESAAGGPVPTTAAIADITDEMVEPKDVKTAQDFQPEHAYAYLRQTAKTPFAKCRSCLPASVQAAYNSAVRQHLSTGLPPAAALVAEGGPLEHFTAVADLAQREGAMYRQRLREMVTVCEYCVHNRSVKQKSAGAQPLPDPDYDDESFQHTASHVCSSHNALPDSVTEHMLPLLIEQARNCDGATSDCVAEAVNTRSAIDDTAAGLLVTLDGAPLQQLRQLGIRGPTAVRSTQWLETSQAGAAPRAPEKLDGLPLARYEATQLVVPSAPVAEPHPSLAVALVRYAAAHATDRSSFAPHGAHLLQFASATKTANTPMPFAVTVPALTKIAMTLFSSGQLSYAVPVGSCVGAAGQRFIAVGDPCVESSTSRKAAFTEAVQHVLSSSTAVWKAAPAEPRLDIEAVAEVTLPSAPLGVQRAAEVMKANMPLQLLVPIPIAGRTSTSRPVMTMAKLEYLSKGYNMIPDKAIDSYRLEQLSKRELVTALIMLHLQPQAVLHIHRVNAYTQALMAVEVHTLSSMTSLANSSDSATELTGLWSTIAAVLTHVRSVMERTAEPAADGTLAYVLVKSAQSKGVCMMPKADVDAAVATQHAAAAQGLCHVAIASYSAAACKQEYLPQANWPRRDRIPFTFPPQTAADARDGGGEGALIHRETLVALESGAGTEDLTAAFRIAVPQATTQKRARGL
jgi:hypothetical protein